MIPVMVINNNSLVDGLPEIDFVDTYQYRRNKILHWDIFPITWNKYKYIAHDDVGLFNWNYLDVLLGDEYNFHLIEPDYINHYSTSIGPACLCAEIVNGVYVSKSTILDDTELLEIAKQRIRILSKKYESIGFSFENTAFRSGNTAYLYITKPSFIQKLVCENEVGFTLDIAHALITARTRKISIHDYLNDLPLERCNEIHLSTPVGLEDSHKLPNEFVMGLFKYVKPKVQKDAYVVVEYYKDMKKLKYFYENVLVRYL